MLNALCIIILVSLTGAALLRSCLPGEVLHRFANPVYQWMQLHRPFFIPQKLTWCVFCASFWFLGIPTALLAAFFIHGYALLIPLPLAYLVEHFTARLFIRN